MPRWLDEKPERESASLLDLLQKSRRRRRTGIEGHEAERLALAHLLDEPGRLDLAIGAADDGELGLSRSRWEAREEDWVGRREREGEKGQMWRILTHKSLRRHGPVEVGMTGSLDGGVSLAERMMGRARGAAV
jgi:hypothetical protein